MFSVTASHGFVVYGLPAWHFKHDDNSELGHLDTHIMVKECFSCVFFTFLHFQLSAMINADTDILANS